MTAVDDVVTGISAVLAVCAAIAGGYAVWRERTVSSTLDTLRGGIQSIRDLYETERSAREDAEQRCRTELASRDLEIAKLSGQVATLESTIVGSLVEQLRNALVDAVHQAIESGDRRKAKASG